MNKYYDKLNDDIDLIAKRMLSNNIEVSKLLSIDEALYIDFNITILERFMEKFLDKEDIIDIKLSNGFFIIPIDVILHSLNIIKEELIKYKKKE